MNFLNIGTAELMLIFIIALIVVGPRRLPEVGRSLGKVVNDVRQMSQEFTAPIMQEMNAPTKENETKEIVDQSVSEKAVHGDQG
jgi:sec-independent protein translocase protein TatB